MLMWGSGGDEMDAGFGEYCNQVELHLAGPSKTIRMDLWKQPDLSLIGGPILRRGDTRHSEPCYPSST